MSRTRRHGGNRNRREDVHESFRCAECRRMVPMQAVGTRHRNHCPSCLWSCHVDRTPGDRSAGCGGRMEPIAIWVRPDDEWAVVHRCVSCHVLKLNRIAGDDNEFVLMSLATRPIARPAFPLEPLTPLRHDDDD